MLPAEVCLTAYSAVAGVQKSWAQIKAEAQRQRDAQQQQQQASQSQQQQPVQGQADWDQIKRDSGSLWSDGSTPGGNLPSTRGVRPGPDLSWPKTQPSDEPRVPGTQIPLRATQQPADRFQSQRGKWEKPVLRPRAKPPSPRPAPGASGPAPGPRPPVRVDVDRPGVAAGGEGSVGGVSSGSSAASNKMATSGASRAAGAAPSDAQGSAVSPATVEAAPDPGAASDELQSSRAVAGPSTPTVRGAGLRGGPAERAVAGETREPKAGEGEGKGASAESADQAVKRGRGGPKGSSDDDTSSKHQE